VKEWKKNLSTRLKEMKTAWYEWNFAGIKELQDKPGTYLFMSTILTADEESSESQESQTLPQVTNGITYQLTETAKMTAKSGTPYQNLNPSFRLEASTPRTWAQCAKTSLPSSEDSAPLTDSQSVNLLETSSIEPEGDLLTQEEDKDKERHATQQIITKVCTKVTEHQSLISDIQAWQKEKACISCTFAKMPPWQVKHLKRQTYMSFTITFTI
jgi:hypothetical protein